MIMKLVTCMGGVWKLSDAKYKALVQYIAAGGADVCVDDYGTYLGDIKMDVTDIDSSKVMSCRMEVPGYPEYAEFQKVKAQLASAGS